MTKTDATRLCSIDDCGDVHFGRGFCQGHYSRFYRNGKNFDRSSIPHRGRNGSVCDAPDCTGKPVSWRMCRGHYERLQRYGDIQAHIPLRPHRVDAVCIVPGCFAQHYGKEMCRKHWHRTKETGSPHVPVKRRTICKARCGRPASAAGYCNTHYERIRRGQSDLGPIRLRTDDCRLPNCGRTHYSRGFCAVHYQSHVSGPRRRYLYLKTAGFATADQLTARIDYYAGRCWMCGAKASCIDHVKPLIAGGPNWPSNLRPACTRCNLRKHAHWTGVSDLTRFIKTGESSVVAA